MGGGRRSEKEGEEPEDGEGVGRALSQWWRGSVRTTDNRPPKFSPQRPKFMI